MAVCVLHWEDIHSAGSGKRPHPQVSAAVSRAKGFDFLLQVLLYCLVFVFVFVFYIKHVYFLFLKYV